jgi:hypothetical protein
MYTLNSPFSKKLSAVVKSPLTGKRNRNSGNRHSSNDNDNGGYSGATIIISVN